ncbi:MAG TPA: YhfX family PLP-dependent enzyme [Bacillota bacterium]|nr:YhfX family PLP-dependent enzyme [Bacillota bacterium]
MFLDVTKRRNPKLVKTGVHLHQKGMIPPNTTIIDVDALRENVRKLVQTAESYDMKLYLMTKQLGRIPKVAEIIAEEGMTDAVAVDFDEGKILADNGIAIGNIGHLVQPGKYQWEEVLSWDPEVVTIFSYERAKQLSEVAERLNKTQDILLKVYDKKDAFYAGQEGGIFIDELVDTAQKIQALPGISIVGVTTFPNLTLSKEKTEMIPTNNFKTLFKAKEILEGLNIELTQINGPSGTSCATIPFLAKEGVTHSEPGHGLTGTTPLHAYNDLPELPAIVYVSEVSHRYKDQYQVIAGGYYGRSNMRGCLVGGSEDEILDQYTKAHQLSPEAIDYYGLIDKPEDFKVNIGDTAVFAFRTQIFVTRSHVALVEGIQSGQPEVIHFERNW